MYCDSVSFDVCYIEVHILFSVSANFTSCKICLVMRLIPEIQYVALLIFSK